jgi:hypothetical protein
MSRREAPSHNIRDYDKKFVPISVLSLPKLQPKTNNYIKKSSKKEIKWLEMCESRFNIPIEKADKQHFIVGPDKGKYYFDGFNLAKMIVWEFLGCYWHQCPICNKDRDSTCLDIYNKTIQRLDFIKSKGYNVVIIWEHEYDYYLKGKSTTLYTYY